MQVEYSAGVNRRAEWLALGFGTAIAMWAIGYLLRLPFINAPGWLILSLMLLSMLGGGILAGRWGGRGLLSGVQAGLVTALLNLLILGSLLSNEQLSGALMGLAALLSIAFGCLVGLLGALLGRAGRKSARVPDWTPVFAWITAGGVLLLIIAGGLVTSYVAGMAVPDWPNTEGTFMFLYPLARMNGGIYFEHAHRLLGSLAGLSVLALALHFSFGEPRRWIKTCAWAAFALVVIQGIFGGVRVVDNSLTLAVVHGVLAQVIYALIVGLAVAATRGWRKRRETPPPPGIGSEIGILAWLIPLVVVQIFLGAVLRHFHSGLHLHITLAVIVLIFGLIAGIRAWGIYQGEAIYNRAGLGLVYHLGAQLMLGFAAWAAVGAAGDTTPVYMVVIATLHQTTGALVLSAVVKLLLWARRLTGWI